MSRELLQQALAWFEDVDGNTDEGVQAPELIIAIKAVLAQPDNTSKQYEELRVLIDGGSESFTHKDAVQYLEDNLAPLKWTPEEDAAYRPGGLAQPEQTHSQNPKFTMDEWAAHARKHQWRFDEEPVTGVATLAQPEQEPMATQLLNRLEHQWHRMGELWERCQGNGWPSAESDEFTALRDEKTPANRAALLAIYTSPPQRHPLTPEQLPPIPSAYRDGVYLGYCKSDFTEYARAIEAKLKELNT